jgi:hypothetical protein
MQEPFAPLGPSDARRLFARRTHPKDHRGTMSQLRPSQDRRKAPDPGAFRLPPVMGDTGLELATGSHLRHTRPFYLL